MSVLLLALGFYFVGIAAALVVRPQLMFRETGQWKEFGLSNTATYTVFPFWMFAIVWSILSYCLAMLLMVFFVSSATTVAPANNLTNTTPSIAQPISAAAAPVPAAPLPPLPSPIPAAVVAARDTTVKEAAGRLPGYYALEEGRKGALPRYVYYGAQPPTFFE